MNANEIREALLERWPDSEYLSVPEAPERADRSGRKIDLLVIALWKSRGLHREAVEIKVSYGDWRRELQRGRKADFWWRHSHRFWIAVPAALAAKVKSELPPGWGLIACAPGQKPKVVAKAQLREAEDLPWPVTVGIMRAAADCGINALRRAEQRGYESGLKAGERMANREPERAKEELRALREKVARFEKASGLVIAGAFDWGQDLGGLVALIRREQRDPGFIAHQLGNSAAHAIRNAENLLKAAKEAEDSATRLTEIIESATSDIELEANGQRTFDNEAELCI